MRILWISGAVALLLSFIFDRSKTWKGVRTGLRMFLRILPDFLIVLAAAALLLAVIPETALSHWIGRDSGLRGFASAALAGSIALVPGFIAFPLAALLLKSGVTKASVAVFITTLMMVGIFTLPVEKTVFRLEDLPFAECLELFRRLDRGFLHGAHPVKINRSLKIRITVLALVAAGAFVSSKTSFQAGTRAISRFSEFFLEMIAFLPVLFILIGLLDVWVPRERVERHFGKESGIRGIFWVILLAMLQAGPLYGAFPVSYMLWKKGCSVRNIFIYLGAFSTLKIPMLTFETGFLGLRFTLVRTALTLPVFILIAFAMERLTAQKGFSMNDSR